MSKENECYDSLCDIHNPRDVNSMEWRIYIEKRRDFLEKRVEQLVDALKLALPYLPQQGYHASIVRAAMKEEK